MDRDDQELSLPSQKDYWFKPGWGETAVYLISSLIMLCATNMYRFWNAISEGQKITGQNLQLAYGDSVTKVNQILSADWLGHLVVLLLWGFVGCLVYTAIWLTQNSLGNLTQGLSGKPLINSSKNKNPLQSVWARYVFFMAFSFIAIVCIYLFFALLIPVFGNMFYNAVISLSPFIPSAVAGGLIAILFMAIAIYGLWLILRVYARFWSIYVRNA